MDGALHNKTGVDVHALVDHLEQGGQISDFEETGTSVMPGASVFEMECDVFIPAALGGVIDEAIAEKLQVSWNQSVYLPAYPVTY